ncbi:MAG: DsrE/DsrF/DrsH-like family protein [Nitrospirae bacterium]|nr:DsrE/DsrF/DrsH-like family protein [Nitrospirota bacterium]
MSIVNKEVQELVDEKLKEAIEIRLNGWIEQKVNTLVEARLAALEAKFKKEESRKKRFAIVASKGSMDMAYPPLILASTAAALDMEAAIFFTFYGLDIINKKKFRHLKVPSLANPAMPIPVPNFIGALPGMTAMATLMMKSWMTKAHVATVPELIELCQECGVRLIGCQMTMDVMGVKKSDLIDGIEIGGAATFLDYAAEDDIPMFV